MGAEKEVVYDRLRFYNQFNIFLKVLALAIVYYFTALHSCSAYGNKCWSAWSKPNWNSLAQTLEPEYDLSEVTGGLWVGRSQTYARPV